MAEDPVVFEKEMDITEMYYSSEEAVSVTKDGDGVYIVEGPRVDRMLGYTNLESEKGFSFFQRFMRENGILDQLKDLGIEEGDTVRVGEYLEFDYYD